MKVQVHLSIGLAFILIMCFQAFRGKRGGTTRRINQLITNRYEGSKQKTNSVDFRNLIELTPQNKDPLLCYGFSSNVPVLKNNGPILESADRCFTDNICKQKTADRSNLVTVKLQDVNSKRLSIGLLNSQSLKNKCLLISDLLIEKSISLLFLTETWIQNDHDEIFFKQSSPTGYSFHHKPRPNGARGGGVGVIYNECIKLLNMSTQFKAFRSFEYQVLSASIHGESVWFFIIYRPPPSKTNNIQKSQFVPEFTELLETALLKAENVCFLGDFNIPWDMVNQSERSDFASTLSSLNLHQHIQSPTHSKGHTLEYVITRSDSSLFTLDDVSLLLSDHYLILGALNFKKPQYPTTEVQYRKLKDIDTELFQNEIMNSSLKIDNTVDIESAVKQYNSVLISQLLDKFAPVKTTTVVSRPKKSLVQYRYIVEKTRKTQGRTKTEIASQYPIQTPPTRHSFTACTC